MAERSINRKDGTNNMRRNSTGKATASSKAEKVLPHYLRASTGSCHDFCKYGRKHAFDAKEKRPVILKNVTKPPDGRKFVEGFEPPHRKRTSPVKLNEFPNHEPSAREKSGYLKQKVVTKSPPVMTSAVLISGFIEPEMVTKPPVGISGTVEREAVNDSHGDTSRVTERDVATNSRDVATNSRDVTFIEKGVITDSSADTSSVIKREVTSAVDREASTRSFVGSVETSKQKMSRKPVGGQIPAKKTSEVVRRSFPDTSEIVKRDLSRKSLDERSTMKNKVFPEKITAVKPISTSNFSGNHKLSKLKVTSSSKLKAVPPPTQMAFSKMKSVTDKASSSSSILSGGLHSRRNNTVKSVKNTSPSELSGNAVKSRKNTSPSSDISGGLHGRSSNAVKSGKNTSSYSSIKPETKAKTTNAAAKEVLTTPRAIFSGKPSLRRSGTLNSRGSSKVVVPSRKNPINTRKPEVEERKLNQANEDAIEEKTLYVIKMKTNKILLQSDQNKRCTDESFQPPASLPVPESPAQSRSSSSSSRNEEDEDEYEFSMTETEDDVLSVEEETDGLEGEHNLRRRNNPVRSSIDETSKQVKLHFKRGTIVDIQTEANSTRRLKFRRGTVLGENQNIKPGTRRIFKKREVDDGNTDNNPDHEKVVLRHQDVVQGKKDNQGLFNNVIEETASKLVETRKSKVKALVGAFETVISLQEI